MFTNYYLHKSKHKVLQKQTKNVKIINLQKLYQLYINNHANFKDCKTARKQPIF